MIPKTIHYCWFGGAPLPELAEKCIASWKEYCPEYEIIEWNESNYSLENVPEYVKEAVAAKRWAFATDYIRLDVVYCYGGIYLDTDVELLRELDDLLNCEAFFARDKGGPISTGLGFGAEKHCECVGLLRDDYNGIHFRTGPATYDLLPCPQRNKKIFDTYGFSDDTEMVEKMDGIVVYPYEYFSPMDCQTLKICCTENTYSIHHFAASWKTEQECRSTNRRHKIVQLFGAEAGTKIADVLNGTIRKMCKAQELLKFLFGGKKQGNNAP